MRILTVIEQRWTNRWKRTAGAAFTIALLSALVVVGITLFGSEVVAAWKTPENAELALSSGGAFEGLLNFEAPAETVARFGSNSEKAESSIKKAGNAFLVVKNWKFTAANPALEALLATNMPLDFLLYMNNNSNGIQEFLEANSPLNFIAASGALYLSGLFLESLLPRLNPALSAFTVAYVNGLRSLQISINSNIFPAIYRPPLIPPISPSF